MVLLPGCACCGGTCFLSAPYPEYIEIDLDFGAAVGTGSATATFTFLKMQPGTRVLLERTTNTVNHTVSQNPLGVQTCRLNHLGSGNFGSYLDSGQWFSAQVIPGAIEIDITCAVHLRSSTSQTFTLSGGEGAPTTNTNQKPVRFYWRFGCSSFQVITTPDFYPQNANGFPFDRIALGNVNKQYCSGTVLAQDFKATKPPDLMFPFKVELEWLGAIFPRPYVEAYRQFDNSLIGLETLGETSFSAQTTYPAPPDPAPVSPPPHTSIQYGFKTVATLTDVRVKYEGSDPVSVNQNYAQVAAGWSGYPASCQEWLSIE